jgi:hypothetical protein
MEAVEGAASYVGNFAKTVPLARGLLCEDSDSDIPILKQAEAEYAKLQ